MSDNQQLYHDSHSTFYREPFGAVPTGTRITLRLAVGRGVVPAREGSDMVPSADANSADIGSRVLLRAWIDGGERLCAMRPRPADAEGASPAGNGLNAGEADSGEYDIYECEFDVGEKPGLVWYYFIVEAADGRQRRYGNNPDMLGGAGFEYADSPASYQVTVYDRDFHTPEWLRHCVMYQIFPDRFHRRRQKPLTQEDVERKRPDYIYHEDWDDTPIYKPDPRTGEIMNNDFFGGNLAGIAAKLPYLSELGISAIYLNPIFEAYSNHRYDTGNYRKVDALLGSEREFASLCVQARKYGIRLILDGVFNHTGSDSLYFNREGHYRGIGAYQSARSRFYSWYKFEHHPDKYDCWWNFLTLPNINESDPDYLDYILDGEDSVIKHWLRQGASGWRLDVVDELPDDFVKRLRKNVKAANRDAVVIGEVWEDASNKVSYGTLREYFLGGELDSVMNYVFKNTLLAFALGRTDARRFDAEMKRLAENYPRECFYSLMNLVGGHDVPRVLTLLSDPPGDLTRDQKALHRPTDRKRRLGVKRLKLTVLIQMTFPGAPCVYYGDEAGMTGFEDPFNRGPFPWDAIDADIHAWYTRVIALRNACAALRTGALETVYAAAAVGNETETGAARSGGVYVYVRRIAGGTDVFGASAEDGFALVAVNMDAAARESVEIDVGKWGIRELYDALSPRPQAIHTATGNIKLTLEPLGCRVLTYPQLPASAPNRVKPLA